MPENTGRNSQVSERSEDMLFFFATCEFCILSITVRYGRWRKSLTESSGEGKKKRKSCGRWQGEISQE